MSKALVIVDMQNDFVTGSLPVPDAEQLVTPIVRLAEEFDVIATTQDWHPKDHVSFVEQGGPFPAHCVANTWGAELVPQIAALHAQRFKKGKKRTDSPAMDAFENPNLSIYLGEVEKLIVVGLTREFCVTETAIGGVRAGFNVVVPLAYTQAIEPEAGSRAIQRMMAAGVRVV
jgi:nicotinamidase/pyrazinamidase